MLDPGCWILDKKKINPLRSSILACHAKLIAMAGQAETSIQYLFASGIMFDTKLYINLKTLIYEDI